LEFSPDEERVAVVLRGVPGRSPAEQELLMEMMQNVSLLGATVQLRSLARAGEGPIWSVSHGGFRLEQHPDRIEPSFPPDAHELIVAIRFLDNQRLLTEHVNPARTLVRSATTGEVLGESTQRYSDHLREDFHDDAKFTQTGTLWTTPLLAISSHWKREIVRHRSQTVVEVRSARGKLGSRAPVCRRVAANEGGPWDQLDERRIVQQVRTDKEPQWRVWDWTAAQSLGRLPRRPLAIDRTGQFAVVLADTSRPEIAHLASGAGVEIPGLPANPLWVAVAANGSQLAAGSSDGTIAVGSPRSDGSGGITINLNLDPPATVGVFSPDGQRLLAARAYGVCLWNLATRLVVYDAPLPMAADVPVLGIACALDGQRAVCWSTAQLALIDPEEGRCLRVFELATDPRVPEGSEAITRIPFFFLPDGLLLVRAPERFQAIDLADGHEMGGASVPGRWRVANWEGVDTVISDPVTGTRIAWFSKPSRSGEVMGDGRTIVLAHASNGRLEILRLEGKLESS
jgi:hypothetical protein